MKVIALPFSYLREQLKTSIENSFSRRVTEGLDSVIILPRALAAVAEAVIQQVKVEED